MANSKLMWRHKTLGQIRSQDEGFVDTDHWERVEYSSVTKKWVALAQRVPHTDEPEDTPPTPVWRNRITGSLEMQEKSPDPAAYEPVEFNSATGDWEWTGPTPPSSKSKLIRMTSSDVRLLAHHDVNKMVEQFNRFLYETGQSFRVEAIHPEAFKVHEASDHLQYED